MKRLPLLSVIVLLSMMLSFFCGCSKGKPQPIKSKLELLRNKWFLFNRSSRTLYSSQSGPFNWITFRIIGSPYTREYKADSAFTIIPQGALTYYTGHYMLVGDSLLLHFNSAIDGIPYYSPDTSYIRKLNDSLFINYHKWSYVNSSYFEFHEELDTLIQ